MAWGFTKSGQVRYAETNLSDFDIFNDLLERPRENIIDSYLCVPTAFASLDDALEGGLYAGLYILGALPSIGKTSFVKQMADQIATQGKDVLYFSLEMARTELAAKSISRHTCLIGQDKPKEFWKTARGIMSEGLCGHKCKNEEQKQHIQKAFKKYMEYARQLFIIEGEGNVGVNRVRSAVESHISSNGNTPVVIIDYLQILTPDSGKTSDKQNTDIAVVELKRISRDYKTPVICISSFNRQNYYQPVGMAAFKESGSIEYSSDVLLGLQYRGGIERGFNVQEAARRTPREIDLVILKNRNGEQGAIIEFDYYPAFNLFKETGRS